MQFTFTLKDKLIKSAITESLDCSVYQQYDSATLKLAKAPKVSALTNQIFEDEKFQAELTKRMVKLAEGLIEDYISDELMYEMDLPGVTSLMKECDRVVEQAREQALALKEAEEVKRMVATLEKAGFKIVKA